MTAADQPPDEWVDLAAKAIGCYTDEQWRRWRDTSKGQHATGRAYVALAAVWPLVQAMIRDAKVGAAPLWLGTTIVERGARNPGCLVWVNHDGTVPDNLVDGEIVERTVYYSPWREVQS